MTDPKSKTAQPTKPKSTKPVAFVFPDGSIQTVTPADAPKGARRATPRDYAISGFHR